MSLSFDLLSDRRRERDRARRIRNAFPVLRAWTVIGLYVASVWALLTYIALGFFFSMSSSKPATAPAAEAAAEELPVIGYLKLIREGEFIDELNEAIQDAIDTATELGKPAMVTIKLGITPAGRTVVIDDDINNKLPKAPKDASIFYLGEGNVLTRRDPKQVAFPADAGFSGAAAPR